MLRSGVQASAEQVVGLSKTVVTAGLAGTAIFGFGIAGMSDGEIPSSSLWLMLAMLCIVVALVDLWALVIPRLRAAVALEGDAAVAAMKKVSPALGIIHLTMAVGLYLMLWQPGT